jgi:hypothetical protein
MKVPVTMKGILRFFLIFILLVTCSHLSAQELLRLELEASDLSLPFYTIPVGRDGVVVFRSTEQKSRRLTGWELTHYNTGFISVAKVNIDAPPESSFAGWEVNDHYILFLFLEPVTSLKGQIFIYNIHDHQVKKVDVDEPDTHVRNLFFVLSGDVYFLGSETNPQTGKGLFTGKKKKPKDSNTNLFILSGNCAGDSVQTSKYDVNGMSSIARVQALPNQPGVIVAIRTSVEKYKEEVKVFRFTHNSFDHGQLLFSFPSSENYLVDMSFSMNNGRMVTTGTFGTRTLQSWKRDETVLAKGFFFATEVNGTLQTLRFHPFSSFHHLPPDLMKEYFENASGKSDTHQPRDKFSYRLLLHDDPYLYNQELILVAEAYNPEYEYENRTQTYSSPFSYYGYYYPGYYDMGGRWVFKGFRYEYAVLAALDSTGNLLWENGFETSNALDKNLSKRLSILPYLNEVVLVYAFDGRIWYRVIQEKNVVVGKESVPVELKFSTERIRENYSMNMSRWYDNYFLVWGRQVVVNNDGKSRTVYYCNKLAFE